MTSEYTEVGSSCQKLGLHHYLQRVRFFPTQQIEFLDYKFDLMTEFVLLGATKKKKKELYSRKITSSTGYMALLEKTIPWGCLHKRPLHWLLKLTGDIISHWLSQFLCLRLSGVIFSGEPNFKFEEGATLSEG